jgi:hypothetical protein
MTFSIIALSISGGIQPNIFTVMVYCRVIMLNVIIGECRSSAKIIPNADLGIILIGQCQVGGTGSGILMTFL